MASIAAFAGESLDALVWRVMGTIAGAVERTMELNPQHLASPFLAEGALVTLPDDLTRAANRPAIRQSIKLWD